MKHLGLLTTAAVIAIGTISFSAMTQAQDDASFSEGQVNAITDIFEKHLEENPNLVIEAMRRYEENQQREEDEKAKQSIKTNLSKLTDKNLPSFGNPEADVTVVEFFDYNCGYCKRAVPDIQKIVENDDNVRFVFKEMPILGPSSKTAAQYALAAHKQGKYFDFHVALMEHRGQKDEAAMEKIGKDLELDIDQLAKDAKSEEINQEIENIITLASDIGIRGTPAFIVEDKLFRGYLGPNGLKNEIEEARKDRKEEKDKDKN